MQILLPGMEKSILANIRQRIRNREVELARHGKHNANSHKLHLHVTYLSEVHDEKALWGYLGHLGEMDR